MFRKVIVGVDGGEGGRDAIALALVLCAPGAEMTLAHVYLDEPVAWRGTSAPYEATLRADAEKILESSRQEAGIQADIRWHGAPTVGRGLHEMAEMIEADLLVIGSTRHGHVGRVLNADDTRHSLNGSPCPVAVAPSGYSQLTDGIHKIGVGYDEAPESEAALRFALELASEHQWKVAACQVIYSPARYLVGPAFPDRNTVMQSLAEIQDRIARIDGVEAHAVYGDPAEELGQFSGSVDLLVVGSRGYGPYGRLLYGSTAQKLTRTARCPLLVLTRKMQQHESAPASADAEVAHTT